MNELRGACIIGQSGGPTSVINASAYGVIDTALKSGVITKVLGAEHGIKGVLEDRLFDMGMEDPAELELMKYTPSSALGSCRYKIADPEVDDTDYKRILEVFKKHNVRALKACVNFIGHLAKIGADRTASAVLKADPVTAGFLCVVHGVETADGHSADLGTVLYFVTVSADTAV